MSLNIRLKHSTVQDKKPQASDLVAGELALNINNASPTGYALDDAGAVQQMFGKATETQDGQAEIATQGEVDAGTDDERIITPAKLGQRLTDYTTNTVDAAIAVEAAARTAADALRVLKAGDTMTGPLTVSNDLTVSGAINHPTVAIAYGTVSNRGVLSNSYNIKNVNLIGGGNPSGYDIYFDNVGGNLLEQTLYQMRLKGRIVCCGAISQYDQKTTTSPKNIPGVIVTKRLKLEGFIVMDFQKENFKALEDLSKWFEVDELKVFTEEYKGLDSAPSALINLLKGKNLGKTIIKI